MTKVPIKVAWISYFPIEWLPNLPEPLRNLPRQHPASWQRVLLDEFKGRPDLQIEIIAVRKQFDRHRSFDLEGTRFHCLKVAGGLRTLSLFWMETFLIWRCLRRIQPDLVHAWGSERAAGLVASRLRYPYLVTMQGLLEWYLERVDLGCIVRLEARLERVALRRASVVTCESSFAVDWLRRQYPHLEVRQAEHAANWLFHRLERTPQIKPMRFLFVGPLAAIKGADLLFRALDRLQPELDFQLVVVGSAHPEFMDQLKARTSEPLWNRVVLRKNLTPAEVAGEMARAGMVLFPTRVDTSPNSVKEAVVAGVPVVASAVGGIVDYVLPGLNGFTFPAGDLDAFCENIRRAAAHPLFSQGKVDPPILARMREYLSPRVMAEKFLAAYHRVLERAG